jgi:flagellar biosynthetic protein FliP
MSRKLIIYICAAALLAATATAPAQARGPGAAVTPAASPSPAATQPSGAGNVPGVGDVMRAIEKATGPAKPGGPNSDWSAPVKLAVIFALLALLPSLLVMMTSFTRIIIVLGFLRRALTTQSIPPTVALVGLALFLTIYTMAPTFGDINSQAVQPYLKDQITTEGAITRANDLLKEFMIRQTRESDLAFFVERAGIKPKTTADVPLYVAIPSFAISEFRTAFQMGCLLFIPFLLVDLVISGILLSGGMMMLPPAMISLPFKIILFVLVDGWRLLSEALVRSFN